MGLLLRNKLFFTTCVSVLFQSLQDEINDKLQTISDLAVQCDNLCEMETPAKAEKLKSQLTNLQTQLGNLKLASIEKRGPLRSAIKESERRKKEMDEYENNLKKLQQWVTDTKQMTMAPVHVEPLIIGENHSDLQQVNRVVSSWIYNKIVTYSR